jgi:hypothetical protein
VQEHILQPDEEPEYSRRTDEPEPEPEPQPVTEQQPEDDWLDDVDAEN